MPSIQSPISLLLLHGTFRAMQIRTFTRHPLPSRHQPAAPQPAGLIARRPNSNGAKAQATDDAASLPANLLCGSRLALVASAGGMWPMFCAVASATEVSTTLGLLARAGPVLTLIALAA